MTNIRYINTVCIIDMSVTFADNRILRTCKRPHLTVGAIFQNLLTYNIEYDMKHICMYIYVDI